MTWQVLVAMFVVIPIILLPVVIVWYLNSGRIYAFVKQMREQRAARRRVEEEPGAPKGVSAKGE